MREIVAFFKAVDPSKLSDPGEQLRRVLDFKRELEREKTMLFSTFDDNANFEHQLRRHLAKWVRDHEGEKAGRPNDGASRQVAEQPIPPLSPPASGAPNEASHGEQMLEKADWLANNGHITDAETLFARATAKGNDPLAFIRYGIFLTRLGRFSQAQVMSERVLELASGEEAIHRLRGELDESERMLVQSVASHQRTNSQEEIAKDLGKLGLVALARGLFDQAEQSLQKSLEIK
jgi:tetratricopeptide (TPR) repeat protein